MKDVAKSHDSSQFWILKAASFKISNPDSVGVKDLFNTIHIDFSLFCYCKLIKDQ